MEIPSKLKPPEFVTADHSSITFRWGTMEVECISEAPSSSVTTDKQILYTLEVENYHGSRQLWKVAYNGYANKRCIDDFKPNTAYKFRIKASNKAGSGPWSEEIIASTTVEPVYGSDVHRYVRINDTESLKNFVAKGPSTRIDAPDKFGRTPLMEACLKDSIPLVELLLAGGADIEAIGEGGKTSLLFVCYTGKLKMAEFLRAHGASMNAVDSTGNTPLHAAADGGHADIAQWAIQNGIPVNQKDLRNGWTALHRTAATSGSPDVARVLFKNGADVNLNDNDGKSSLMIAACNNYQNLVEILLQNGADVKYENQQGKTAYDMAEALGRKNIAVILHDKTKN